jgi:hypothetical protein
MAIVRLIRRRDGHIAPRPSPGAGLTLHGGTSTFMGISAAHGEVSIESNFDDDSARGAFGFDDDFVDEGKYEARAGVGAGSLTAPLTMSKVVYLAPLRALAHERQLDWASKFAPLGLTVAIVTGDDETVDDEDPEAGLDAAHDVVASASPSAEDLRALRGAAKKSLLSRVLNADIVVATPEKWDAVTRKAPALAQFSRAVSLLCVDEVHLLGDDRGGVLEALITRMRSVNPALRTVAVSATVPNIRDVGAFIGAGPATCFSFGDKYRPTKLTTYVIGYDGGHNSFLFERDLEARVADIIATYGKAKPALVFCATRSSAQSTAERLAQASQPPTSSSTKAVLEAAICRVSNPALRRCLSRQVAFHSAELTQGDRATVESLFTSGALTVLASTTTLALGVNLPAHLVVVKSTMAWRGGSEGYCELPHTTILQMIGRAGRPQFDTEGVAVIMTTAARAPALRLLAQGAEPVESMLLQTLVEYLCAEIVLGTFSSFDEAAAWLSSTFLARRLERQGAHRARYGLAPGANPVQVGAFITRLLAESVFKLVAAGCVTVAREAPGGGWEEWSTVHDAAEITLYASSKTLFLAAKGPGRILTRAYMRLPTLALFAAMPREADVPSALAALCGAAELTSLVVRRDEKRILREIAERFGRVRSKGPVSSVSGKAFQLMQLALGRHAVDMPGGKAALPFSFRMDSRFISRELIRITRAWASWAVCDDVRSPLLPIASALHRSLVTQIWEDASETRLVAQLPGVTDALLPTLEFAGVTLMDLADTTQGISAAAVSHIVRKPMAWGLAVKAAAHLLAPRLKLCVSQNGTEAGCALLIIDIVAIDIDADASDGPSHLREPPPQRQLTLAEALHRNKPKKAQPASRSVHPGALVAKNSFTLAVTVADIEDGLVYSCQINGPARHYVRVARPVEGPRISIHLLHSHALGVDGHVIVEPVYGAGDPPPSSRRKVDAVQVIAANKLAHASRQETPTTLPVAPLSSLGGAAPLSKKQIEIEPSPPPQPPQLQLALSPSEPRAEMVPRHAADDADPFAELDECLASITPQLSVAAPTIAVSTTATSASKQPAPPREKQVKIRLPKSSASAKAPRKKATPAEPVVRADLSSWQPTAAAGGATRELQVVRAWTCGAPTVPQPKIASKRKASKPAASSAANDGAAKSAPASAPSGALVSQKLLHSPSVGVPSSAPQTAFSAAPDEVICIDDYDGEDADSAGGLAAREPARVLPSAESRASSLAYSARPPTARYAPAIQPNYPYPSPTSKHFTHPFISSAALTYPLAPTHGTSFASAYSSAFSPQPALPVVSSIGKLMATASQGSGAKGPPPSLFGAHAARILDFGGIGKLAAGDIMPAPGGSASRGKMIWPTKGRELPSLASPLTDDIVAAGLSLYGPPRMARQPPAPARGPFPPFSTHGTSPPQRPPQLPHKRQRDADEDEWDQ